LDPNSLVKFRQIERSDLEMLKDWRNDPYVRSICREYRLLNMPMQERWYESIIADTSQLLYIIEKNEHPIGAGGWTYIDWRSRHGLISLYIGVEKDRDTETMLAVLNELHRIAFNELNLNSVKFWFYSWRDDLQVFLDSGYKEMGKFRAGYYHDGQYHDVILLDMLKEEWKNDVNHSSQ
jgi:RimJ/RimL family protein N-acetyltransferase